MTLVNQVEEAEASAAITWLEVVGKAAETDPSWAWRLLKQRYPEGFQDVERREVTGKDGGPIIMSQADAVAALQAAQKAMAGKADEQ